MRAALSWMSLAVALLGVVSYFLVLLKRPHLIRILNGSGLLLSALALSQAPVVLRQAESATVFSLQAMTVLLILAVLAQSIAALRNRRAWDGAERRNGLLEGRA